MTKPFDGKRVALLGGGRGIGRGIALAFGAQGARVALADQSAEYGSETLALLREQGTEAAVFGCDAGVRAQVGAFVEDAGAWLGGIDIVIQNAAVFPYAPLLALTDDDLERTLAVNLKSAFWITQAAVPLLERAPGGGRLLFTSSIAGNRSAVASLAHYAVSKAGLNAFIRNAAFELGGRGITVNGVEPGLVAVERHQANSEAVARCGALIPAGRAGNAADIASAMLYLASEGAAYVTGQTIVVDGGLTLPDLTSLPAR